MVVKTDDIPTFAVNAAVVEWQSQRFASLSRVYGSKVPEGKVIGEYAYEMNGYPGMRLDWKGVASDFPAQHRGVAPMEFVIDLDVVDYDKLRADTERIMDVLYNAGVSFDVWSTAGKSYHIHSAFVFGPAFRKRFAEMDSTKAFGPRTMRAFLLDYVTSKASAMVASSFPAAGNVVIDTAPILFSDDAEYSHLIRAEMGPRKINRAWYYKSYVTSSHEMILPMEYPRAAWPPDSLPPSGYPISTFPESLVDDLFKFAENETAKELQRDKYNVGEIDYGGDYFSLPCIRDIFSGRPIVRHTEKMGANMGARLVGIALRMDLASYAESNYREKALKISRQYKQNLVYRKKGDDVGDMELFEWFINARLKPLKHNCGQVINNFRTEKFSPVMEWCSRCPLDRERRALRASKSSGSAVKEGGDNRQ